MRIALIYNDNNHQIFPVVQEMAAYLTDKGAAAVLNKDNIGFPVGNLDAENFVACDACIVFGGDGSLMATARCLSITGIPFFCVNMGRVGFLSQVEKENVFHAVNCLLKNDYSIKERMLISGTVFRNGRKIAAFSAFNDFVIRSTLIRTMEFELLIDGNHVNTYDADGLIIATPAGSTGYSLSAGGPIVMPDMETLLITPICPRYFFSRPIVTGTDSMLELICNGRKDSSILTADGQESFSLLYGDHILLRKDERKAKLIYFDNSNYFERIKQKLYRVE